MTDPRVARAAEVLGSLARFDVPLGSTTTYRVGGVAAIGVRADDDADLLRVARAVAGSGLEVLVVGKGSNLLVADAGFNGIAVTLGERFATLDLRPDEAETGVARAGGAAALPVVARQTVAAGWRGLGWMVGIPGSIGGAVRMNAGGHGSDTAAHLLGVRVIDLATGEDGEMLAGDLCLGYRTSSLRASQVVCWADLRVERGSRAEGEAEIAEIVRWRRENQPGGQNAGSVFANPPGDSAGRLIDSLGLKGLRIGTAEVSARHANFIQADDGGSASDVHALIVEVVTRVEAATGVRLRPEVRLIGFGAGGGA